MTDETSIRSQSPVSNTISLNEMRDWRIPHVLPMALESNVDIVLHAVIAMKPMMSDKLTESQLACFLNRSFNSAAPPPPMLHGWH